MADPLGPVNPGDDMNIAAVAWNAAMDAARDFRQPGRPDDPPQKFRSAGYIEAMALNSTGAGLDAFKPAKVTGAGDYTLTASESQAFDWTKRPAVTLAVPTAATDQIAVTLEPILNGKYGRVAVAGWVPCDVDVSNASHEYAVPTTDTDALVSGAAGTIRIKATGTGTARRTQVYVGEQRTFGTANSDGTQVGTTFDMWFDQATGIEITQGVSHDTVSLRGASNTQMGAVTTGTQRFAGAKTFNGTLARSNGSSAAANPSVVADIVTINIGINNYPAASIQTTSPAGTSSGFMRSYEQGATYTATDWFMGTPGGFNTSCNIYALTYLDTSSGIKGGSSIGTSGTIGITNLPGGSIGYDPATATAGLGLGIGTAVGTPPWAIYGLGTSNGNPIIANLPFLCSETTAWGAIRGGTMYTGADAVVSGLTFRGGIYTAGSFTVPPSPPGSIGTTDLANNSVTYAKMQDVSAASRLIGRGAGGGSGDPQELSLDSSLALSGTTLAVGVLDLGTW